MDIPPKDSWNAMYFIFFLQGIGQLFPWNVFIDQEEYFEQRFYGSVFESTFENCFSLGYNFARVVGLVWALRYQDKFSLRRRILGSLGVSAFAFVVCVLLVLAEGLSSNSLFLATMVLILISGLSIAVLQGGFFAMVSAFPPRYTQAMVAGQSLAGLVVALIAIFTSLIDSDDQSCVSISTSGSNFDQIADSLFYDSQDTPSWPPKTTAGEATASGSESFHQSEPSISQLFSSVTTSMDFMTLAQNGIAVLVLLGCIVTYRILERLPLTTFYMKKLTTEDGDGSSYAGKIDQGDLTRHARVRDSCTCDRCIAGNGQVCSGTNTDDSGPSLGTASDSIGSSLRRTGPIEEWRQLPQQPLPTLPNTESLRNPLLSADSSTLLALGEGERKRSMSNPSIVVGRTDFVLGAANVNESHLSRRLTRRVKGKFKPISRYSFSVFFCFLVSISMYPAVISEIVSTQGCTAGRARFFGQDTFILFSFVSYNASDFLGRLTAGCTGLCTVCGISPETWLPVAAVTRVVFVPLLLACRTTSSKDLMQNIEWLYDWMSGSDIYPLTIVPLFGFTNGFLVSLSMMGGSRKGPWAGTVMALSLNVGLFAGSLTSFLVLAVNG